MLDLIGTIDILLYSSVNSTWPKSIANSSAESSFDHRGAPIQIIDCAFIKETRQLPISNGKAHNPGNSLSVVV